jgi:hypothetical protein
MNVRRPRCRLFVVTLLALVSLAALLSTRPDFTSGVWSRGDDLALVAAWTIAVVTSAWLFVVTGGCLVALCLGRPRVARRLAPALPSGIRRVLEIAIVTACVALPALPAGAVDGPRVFVATIDDQPVVREPVGVAPVESAPVPRANPLPLRRPAPAGTIHATPPLVAPARVVVRPGDNLWLIARAALEHDSAARVDDAAVARYWRDLIRANRSTLRSGDPSLVFPGEMITLPPAPRVVS